MDTAANDDGNADYLRWYFGGSPPPTDAFDNAWAPSEREPAGAGDHHAAANMNWHGGALHA